MENQSDLRLFLALALPEAVRTEIERMVAPFRQAAREVRFTAPQSLHLTLVFLGARSTAAASAIAEAVQPVCRSHAAFTLRVGRPGCFPSALRPRVLWLGLNQGSDALVSLQHAIAEALVQRQLHTEDEKFTPHLTVGRVDSDHPLPDLGTRWSNVRVPIFAPFPVRHVHLMRSEMLRTGARYSTLQSWPLDGAGDE